MREAAGGGKDVRLSVDIPEVMRRRLKSYASSKGLSVRDYLVQLLDENLPKGLF